MNRQNLERPESPWPQNPRLSSRNPLLQELEQYGTPPSSPDYQNPAHARYFVNQPPYEYGPFVDDQYGTNQQNTGRNRYQPY
jgi:hypothetical protein